MAAAHQMQAYDDALSFLYGRINYERLGGAASRRWQLKLGRMRQLLARLGDPHAGLPCVHIAGTKGKGSTASMISSVLVESGYTTGLYTSPHLECLEQRLQVNGRPCSAEELTRLVDAVRGEVLAMDREAGDDEAGQPTFFEITTAMAFLHFRRRNVQLAVLEVGMGGRLDSTNVCRPLVSVITSISFDHTQQLGKTLSAIAGEKAGILKRAVPLVSGVREEEPRRVITEAARKLHCPVRQLGVDFEAGYHGPAHAPPSNPTEVVGAMSYTRRVDDQGDMLDDPWRQLSNLHLRLWGRHQANNAAVAVEALQVLRQRGWTIRETDLRRGLQATCCPARTEVVSQSPMIVLDVAHNVASVEALVATIEEYCPGSRRVLLLASSKDKDLRGMLRLLTPCFSRILLTRIPNSPRSAPPEKLRESMGSSVRELGSAAPQVSLHEDPRQALHAAIAETPNDGLLCVTGSFFIAAELRQELLKRQPTAPLAAAAG